ncbi:serine/threonine protein kinase [Streptomyces sp. UNOC14_S4]|nr:serine/threonine protein kinase [Streptomyces sp. UNOC14_S4]
MCSMGTFAAHDGLIAGRYRLRERIGRGGMGTVWRATDELLAREVAVKELHMDESSPSGPATAPGSRVDRTLREARAAALISHPNVVALHDIVTQEGRPWIVMELVEGRALSDVLAADGPVGPYEAARIGLALLGALRAAHGRGVLHRDIKPANVLLEDGTGRVVLTDFGIAQVPGAPTITESGAFVGSPEYTAPERIAGGATGPASDLWSLGVLLCVALHGESPFYRDSLGGIIQAVVHDEIRPPAAVGPLLPVVRGLLERDPGCRMGPDEAEALLLAVLETSRQGGTVELPGTVSRRTCALPGRSRAGPVRTPATVPRPAPPATTPYVPPPGPPPFPCPPLAPGPSPRARIALMTGVTVVALAGMGAGITAMLSDHGPGDTDHRPPQVSSGPVAGSGSPFPPGSKVPSAPGGKTPSAPGTAVPSAPVTAPAGYHMVTDPGGFALAVPDGFTRSYEAPRVFYSSPGQEFRLGIRPRARREGGPMELMRAEDEDAPGSYPGYRDGTVTPATHRGHAAALWEFTWTEDSGDARHTYDLCWADGDRTYDVWVSAPGDEADQGRRYAWTALDAFVPVGS